MRSSDSTVVNWREVDWTEQDTIIAQKVGRTRARVGQVRQALRMPRPKMYHQATQSDIRRIKSELTPEIVQGRTTKEVAEILKSSTHNVREAVKQLGLRQAMKPYQKIPVAVANWDLPNLDLAKIWDLFSNTPAIVRRRNRLRNARWDLRSKQTRQDPEYWKAVEAEKAIAEAWKNEHIRPRDPSHLNERVQARS